MSEPIITVENLGKCYRLGGGTGGGGVGRYQTLRESLTEGARQVFRRTQRNKASSGEDFWALRDVSFSIRPGEVVGIIGRNGAGKSTLLKILSRITEPTEGKVTLRGRVASLLEVGTGFHPELTGRENIFLNGAVLGMGRHEIRAKFDEIVAFAEVERFLDTPVKRYSSGMYVRLAFAVAAHLEPEILIVDEVLAVGDAEFQKKCLGKMESVAKGEGRTVLFVSHNMGAINQLCARALFLRQGNLVLSGSTKVVLDTYLSSASDPKQGERSSTQTKAASSPMSIVRVVARGITGQPGTHFGHNEEITLEISYTLRCTITGAEIGFSVRDERGRRIFISEFPVPQGLNQIPSEETLYVTVPGNILVPGRYYFTFHIHVPSVTTIDSADDLLTITLIDVGSQNSRYGDLDYGCVFVDCKWDASPKMPSLTASSEAIEK